MVQREMGFLIQVVKIGVVSGCLLGLLTGCSSQLRTTIVSGSEAPKVQVAHLEPETVVVEEVVAQPVRKETRMDIPVEGPARPAPRSELPAEIFAASKTPDVRTEMPVRSELESSVPAQEEPVVSAVPLASEPAMRQQAVGIPPIDVEPEMPALPRIRQDAGSSASQSEPLAIASTPEVPISAPQPEAAVHVPSAEVRALPAPQPEATVHVPPAEVPPLPAPQPEATVHVPPAEVPPLVAQADIPSTPEPSSQKEPIQVAKVMPQELKQDEIITETLEVALSDVYFDYDQFAIRDDALPILKANVRLLSETLAEKKIVIEGHCDERGTQSYNMVLGERRAKAVKQFLGDLGVPTENLQVMSYGKDMPFCTEQTEDCWQENRRGHFVIK